MIKYCLLEDLSQARVILPPVKKNHCTLLFLHATAGRGSSSPLSSYLCSKPSTTRETELKLGFLKENTPHVGLMHALFGLDPLVRLCICIYIFSGKKTHCTLLFLPAAADRGSSSSLSSYLCSKPSTTEETRLKLGFLKRKHSTCKIDACIVWFGPTCETLYLHIYFSFIFQKKILL